MTTIRTPLRFLRQSTPASPAAGYDTLYSDSGGKLTTVDSSGVQQVVRRARVFTSTAYTNATTTATNVGGLTASLAASGLYLLSGYGQWSMNSLTGTPFVAMFLGGDGTLTTTLLSYRFSLQNNQAGAPTTSLYTVLAPASPTTAKANDAAFQYAWEFTGMVRVNVAGSISVQAKIGSGTGTMTVATGSVMFVEQVG